MNKFRLKRGLYNKKKKVFPFYDRPLTYKTNRSINQLKNAHKEMGRMAVCTYFYCEEIWNVRMMWLKKM